MLLIRNSKGEISLYTGKLRHPISAQAYADYCDSTPFVQVTDDYYNAIPAGKALQGSVNLGGAETPTEALQDGTDAVE